MWLKVFYICTLLQMLVCPREKYNAEIVPVLQKVLVRAVAAGGLALSVFLYRKNQNTDNCLLKV